MKKLVMFGFAVVAACAVNAAAFDWTAGSVNGVDGTGATLTSTEGAAKIVLAYLGNGESASFANAVAVQTGTWDIGSGKSGAYSKVAGTYTGTGTGALANGNVYAVMVELDDGSLTQLKALDGTALTTTYTVTGYSGDTWSGAAFQFATGSYLGDKASYAVPEPTSGLLMLVGLGALALRRRRA
ncbi:MAG: PEP-CTERM sorting domain-containing protein [Kiritimatiellae bacterium]|nr:PEP-CTERM sorting domain-containing protein [Kiritimatiellia bacterium]